MGKFVDASKLARWRCHKVVGAGRILGITKWPDVSREYEIAEIEVEFADGSREAIEPDAKLFARYQPELLDYYVVYDDGYVSISPRKAFEEGYSRERPPFDLAALQHLRKASSNEPY